MDWNALLNLENLSSVLPNTYGWIIRPIQTALALFLSKLPENTQQKIIQTQFQLGFDATVSARIGGLARQSPVLHKLGQVLARDQRLAPDLRHELQQLEWLKPTTPPQIIKETLHDEFGPLSSYGIDLAPHGIAEASVAVVIPFTYSGAGHRQSTRQWSGVFKVLKPEIETRLNHELDILEEVGHHLEKQCSELGIPQLEYKDTFYQVAEGLRREVQLDKEQYNLKEAAHTYRDVSEIHIPTLLEPCSPRATAMEWISGEKLESANISSQPKRNHMAALVTRALIASPVFSTNEQAIFHGDPHAGNLFRTSAEKLAILDWSLAGQLNKLQRAAMNQICLAGGTFQAERISALIDSIADGPVRDPRTLLQVVNDGLTQLRYGKLPGLTWLIKLLDEAVVQAKLQLPTDLILFRKSLLTLSGQIEELTGNARYADMILLHEFIHHFTVEWPTRWYYDSHNREYATHLSNRDLFEALSQIWLQPWQQLIGNH